MADCSRKGEYHLSASPAAPKDGCLDAYWKDTAEGLPSRKYYTITDPGRAYLAAMEAEWSNLMEAITELQEETKMNGKLNKYQEQIDKNLRSMPVSDRVDIVQELKSEISELVGEGISADEITARLGDPRELARCYLGESISKTSEFSWRKLVSVIGFYSYAGIGGMFVLPITGTMAVTLGICGFLIPIAGLVKLMAFFMGHDIPQIQFVVGSYSANAYALFPISLVLGLLCIGLAYLCWWFSLRFIRSLSKRK